MHDIKAMTKTTSVTRGQMSINKCQVRVRRKKVTGWLANETVLILLILCDLVLLNWRANCSRGSTRLANRIRRRQSDSTSSEYLDLLLENGANEDEQNLIKSQYDFFDVSQSKAEPVSASVAAPETTTSLAPSSTSTSQTGGGQASSGSLDTATLSDTIIAGVTSSILKSLEKQQQDKGEKVVRRPGGGRPTPVVGQFIDGNIEYDSNQNTINGFIELPSFLNFSQLLSNKPSNGSALPILVTALKTIPIKWSAVCWKLLNLLAWKKVFKTHHPKSAEISIEQEVKLGGNKHKSGMPMALKASKMGHSYGSTGDFDATSLFDSGHGGAWPMFGADTLAAGSATHEHRQPPDHYAHNQAAAAAAAAAASAAAAVQSHYLRQQSNEIETSAAKSEADTKKGGEQLVDRRAKQKPNTRQQTGGDERQWSTATYSAAAAAASAAANAAAASMVAEQQAARAGPFAALSNFYNLANYEMQQPSIDSWRASPQQAFEGSEFYQQQQQKQSPDLASNQRLDESSVNGADGSTHQLADFDDN